MGCDIINLNILSFCVVSVHNVVLFQSQSHLSRVHIYWDKEIRITMPSKGLTVHYSSIDRQNIWESPNKSAILEKTKSSFLPFFFLFAHSCQRPSAEMPTKLPCHQAEWHQRRQPGGRRWQQHTALTGMSTEMQLRPLTASSFWRSVRRGKSFNRPDFKYFSNLPNHICFSKWRILMFKQSIRTT